LRGVVESLPPTLQAAVCGSHHFVGLVNIEFRAVGSAAKNGGVLGIRYGIPRRFQARSRERAGFHQTLHSGQFSLGDGHWPIVARLCQAPGGA
jgi:hypothetical protein